MTAEELNSQPFPDREFDQTEAWVRLEEAVTQTLSVLPSDFPDFEVRKLQPNAICYTDKEEETDFVKYQVRYEVRGTDPSFERYATSDYQAVKQGWEELGFEIWDERTDATGEHLSIQALRPDGINLWYKAGVTWGVSLVVQSGCVPSVDGFQDRYIPAQHGVQLENDRLPKSIMDKPEE